MWCAVCCCAVNVSTGLGFILLRSTHLEHQLLSDDDAYSQSDPTGMTDELHTTTLSSPSCVSSSSQPSRRRTRSAGPSRSINVDQPRAQQSRRLHLGHGICITSAHRRSTDPQHKFNCSPSAVYTKVSKGVFTIQVVVCMVLPLLKSRPLTHVLSTVQRIQHDALLYLRAVSGSSGFAQITGGTVNDWGWAIRAKVA